MNLGKRGIKMGWTKVSRNSQLYSEHQAVYSLRVQKSYLRKEYNLSDKPRVTKPCLFTEARE